MKEFLLTSSNGFESQFYDDIWEYSCVKQLSMQNPTLHAHNFQF